MDQRQRLAVSKRSHTRVALAVIALVLAMVGLSFAAVPLYALFCKATGYAGTPQVAGRGADRIGHRSLIVRFDANVAPGLAWTFEPEIDSLSVRTGETTTVYFKAVNRSATETAAVAAFNVTPEQTGAWFNKISCFCFNEQRLGAHESAEMPVVFFLDPALETDPSMTAVDTLTLSYTFFPAKHAVVPVAAATEVKSKL
jgi:cytochrome c oxidase assembly protein subunit 11